VTRRIPQRGLEMIREVGVFTRIAQSTRRMHSRGTWRM
jgi:hypothetical protein